MNSSRKGADGERELANKLREYGYEITRGGTTSFGTVPDLSGLPGIHIECKRVERLNVLEAMQQSIRDADKFEDGKPALFHRRSRSPWLVTMLLDDWMQIYRRTNTVTHWKKLTNPDYLGAYSLEDRQDIILTIDRVQLETVTGPDGKKEECLVCHWREREKPMILNATNAKMIEKLLQTPYIEEWSGHKIQIGAEKVKAFGDIVDALRIRPFLPKAVTVKCERCGEDIKPAHGLNSEQLAAYTKQKYGAALCAACATKVAGNA